LRRIIWRPAFTPVQRKRNRSIAPGRLITINIEALNAP
jgi:hypothetical protein